VDKTLFGNLGLTVDDTVYEPAEDSFLLAKYATKLRGRILEVGAGSGIVALSAAATDMRNDVLGVDISPAAVECAKANAKRNGISNCEFIESDLFSKVPTGRKFDAILFNPPYLPTAKGERIANRVENAAYDGGKSGLSVFLRFARQVEGRLKPGGNVAVIATSLGGGIGKTVAALEKNVGAAKIVAEESFFFEKLALVEATKNAVYKKKRQ